MASFNFADAAGRGYKFVWDERSALSYYGFWPVMLKVSTFVLIAALELEKNLLRQGLMLLPAYFLEGWLVAVAIRMAVFGERRPEPLNPDAGSATPEAAARRRTILAGILVYVLIRLVSSLLSGVLAGAGEMEYTPSTPPPGPGVYFTVLCAFAVALWMFRYFWLHIPVIIDYPVARFMRVIRGFASSFYMMALWLLCMVPVVVVIIAMARVLMVILPGHAPGTPSLAYMYVLTALQAVMETVVVLIANVAMSYGILQMLSADENSRHRS